MSWLKFFSTKMKKSVQLCEKETKLGTRSVLCFCALVTRNLFPAGRWQNCLWNSKGTRWVMFGKKNFSQWSHHHTGLWLGSKAQDASGVSHLRSDLIPGKRLWAPSSVQDFQDHVPTSSVCWAVQWVCQCALFSWLLLDILYFPKETHKVKSRTCSHGSVANTLSSW